MDTRNQQIVSEEKYRELESQGKAKSFKPVPKSLESQARRALAGRASVKMDKKFRYELRKHRVLMANRRREDAIREAKARLTVMSLGVSREKVERVNLEKS